MLPKEVLSANARQLVATATAGAQQREHSAARGEAWRHRGDIRRDRVCLSAQPQGRSCGSRARVCRRSVTGRPHAHVSSAGVLGLCDLFPRAELLLPSALPR